jgi:hypothetical protein
MKGGSKNCHSELGSESISFINPEDRFWNKFRMTTNNELLEPL